MRPLARFGLPLMLVGFAVANLADRQPASHEVSGFDLPVVAPNADSLPALMRAGVVSSGQTPMVHSATAAVLADGALLAAWYGGTEEGHSDVRIFVSRYDPELDVWSSGQALFDPLETGVELGRAVTKLGNPVLMKHPGGSLWMFYVSVSVGGWSGSSINLSISDDEGRSWSPARRLITSPLLNLGHLVRSTPVLFRDGRVGLPVYHDGVNRFAELALLSEDGEVVDKYRMSPGPSSLQPAVIPFREMDAVGFFRSSRPAPGFMLRGETRDGGVTWSEPVETGIPNRDSGFAVLRLSSGDLVTAYNNSQEGRVNLYLASSTDRGRTWNTLVEIEGENSDEMGAPLIYEYPHLVQDDAGYVHLLYTWDRREIRHVRFSESWLREGGG